MKYEKADIGLKPNVRFLVKANNSIGLRAGKYRLENPNKTNISNCISYRYAIFFRFLSFAYFGDYWCIFVADLLRVSDSFYYLCDRKRCSKHL